MYQLTDNPDAVLHITEETTTLVARGTWLWSIYEEFQAAGGVPYPVPLPTPPYELYTPAHFRAIRAEAWAWMTSVVMARGYDTIESCCSYYNSTVDRYRLEARAMVQWRDAVNQKLEELVVTLPPGIETFEQVKQLLPAPGAYPWPDAAELPLDTGEKVGLP